jgi:hypothetical protein
MKRSLVALILAVAFLFGGCGKASKEDCQKAADHLAEKGGLLGQVMGQEMMKEGDNQCEGKWSSKQTECLAGLEEFTAEAMKGCDG